MRKGDFLVDKSFGTKLELLSNPRPNGDAVVKVLNVGEMLDRVKKGDVIKGFAVLYGLLQFEVENA